MIRHTAFGPKSFRLFGVLICALCLPALAAGTPDGLTDIQKAGKLIVGTSADYPPYEFHLLNDHQEEIVGMDIEIAREIAKDLKVELVTRNFVFSSLFPALEKGEVDLVIAGLSPTERRRKVADFSDTYYKALQNLLIRSEDRDAIHQAGDLRGKKVGVQRDSIQADLVRRMVAGAYFWEQDSISDLVRELKEGKVDAVVLERPVADSYAHSHPEFLSLECHGEAEELGSAIAIKKGNKALLTQVNKTLARLKATRRIEQFLEDAKVLMNH